MNMGYLNDSAPQLLRSRASQTGSIFHEGVWPPPGRPLEDPIRAGSRVDLGSIVDNVMGTSSTSSNHAEAAVPIGSSGHVRGGAGQSPQGSIDAGYGYYSDSVNQRSGYLPVHNRDQSIGSSAGSQAAMLPAGARQSYSSISPGPTNRSVTFADSNSSAKAREAASSSQSQRSRLSLISPRSGDYELGMLSSPSTARSPGARSDPEADTASQYSMPSVLAHQPSQAYRSEQALPPIPSEAMPLVDLTQDSQEVTEIPPLYHTIHPDTNTSARNQDLDSRAS